VDVQAQKYVVLAVVLAICASFSGVLHYKMVTALTIKEMLQPNNKCITALTIFNL